MASLERRGDKFRIVFRYAGQKYQHPVRTGCEREAAAVCERLEENLRLLERGRLALPPDADLPTFLVSDGKLNAPPAPAARLTLADLRDRYLAAVGGGSLEDNTVRTARTHFGHLGRALGESFSIRGLGLLDLQGYVDRRGKAKGFHRRPLSPTTIKKELATLRAAWNWGAQAGLLAGPFPGGGLRFPKTAEKPPFRTFAEVAGLVAAGGLTAADRRDLWDGVFLTRDELADLLRHVEADPPHPCVPPMFAFAAMTGARRSEILRLRWPDVDDAAGAVLLHEKKKTKGKRTTRRVALAPPLAEALRRWRAASGGELLVFPADGDAGIVFGANAARRLFRRAVAGSRWRHLRGWHVFRHSFVSNCASLGVDQRLIDDWVGHTTEEMRRRYRHLIPSQQREAIQKVFG